MNLEKCINEIEKASKGVLKREEALKLMAKMEAEASSRNANAKVDYAGLLEDQIIWVKKLEQRQNEARQAKIRDALKVREKLANIDTTNRYTTLRSVKAVANQVEGNIIVNTSRLSSDLRNRLKLEGVLEYFESKQDPQIVAKYVNQLTKIDSDGVPYLPKILLDDIPEGERSAYRVAKATVEHRNDKWKIFRNLGAPVGFLEGRIGKTTYNSVKIAGDIQGFKAALKRAVDWDRMDLSGLTQDQYIDELTERSISGIHDSHMPDLLYYETLVDEDIVTRLSGNLAQRLGRSRKITFKEDMWHDFQVNYGTGDMYDVIRKETETDGRNMGLLESLGSRPEQVWNTILNRVESSTKNLVKPGSVHPLRSQSTGVPFIFDHLTGKVNAPADGMVARVSSSIRKYISTLGLGGSLITSQTDPLTAAARRAYLQQAKTTGEQVGNFVKALNDEYRKVVGLHGDEVAKALAKSVLEEFEDMHYALAKDTRLADIFSSEQINGKYNKGALNKVLNFTDKVHDEIFKFNGLEWWTNNRYASSYSGISAELASYAGKGFDELPTFTQNWFREIGVSDIWGLINNKITKATTGSTYILPNALDDLNLDDIKKLVPEIQTDKQAASYLREAQNKLKVAFAVESRKRVLTTTVSDRAMMLGGSQRGTPGGEFRRFALQFKSFPIALIENQLIPMIADRKFGALGSYLAFSVPIVLTITAIQDLLGGKTPRVYTLNGDEDNDKAAVGNYVALTARILGLPVFDELAPKFLAGELKVDDASALLGPAIGSTFKTLTGVSEAIGHTLDGDTDKIVGDVFPSIYNAPVIGPAMQGHILGKTFRNMIFNNLMEMFNPGYEDKLVEIAENQGSEYHNMYKVILGQ